MSDITTFTGKHFDPVNPKMELLDIRDIAYALSLTCQGNGHVKTFFSVAQHCINCALEAKERLLDMIYQKFLGKTLTEKEKNLVKGIDDDLLYYDLKKLLNEILEGDVPKLQIELDYQFVTFEQVEKQYIQLFRRFEHMKG